MDLSHQSYFIEGDKEGAVNYLRTLINENISEFSSNNPDFYIREFETLNIDDARELKNLLISKPFGKYKVIIISANFIGGEAQNALLKFLEEPGEGQYIFIQVPNASILIPTVRSRLIRINYSASNNELNKESKAKSFLNSTAEERLKILSEFISHESETKKSDLILFIDEIEKNLSSNLEKKPENVTALNEVYKFKKFLYDRSPSIKMIAEHLAITLPMTK